MACCDRGVHRIPRSLSVVLFLVVTFGGQLLLWVGLALVVLWLDEGSVSADQDDLDLVRSRLEVARQGLDAVTPPRGAQADGPAEVSGCRSYDSDFTVLDPNVIRSWQVPGSPPQGAIHDGFEPAPPPPSRQEIAAVADVVRQLEQLGWTVVPDTRGPTETTVALNRGPDATVQITVSTDWGRLTAEASALPSGICR